MKPPGHALRDVKPDCFPLKATKCQGRCNHGSCTVFNNCLLIGGATLLFTRLRRVWRREMLAVFLREGVQHGMIATGADRPPYLSHALCSPRRRRCLCWIGRDGAHDSFHARHPTHPASSATICITTRDTDRYICQAGWAEETYEETTPPARFLRLPLELWSCCGSHLRSTDEDHTDPFRSKKGSFLVSWYGWQIIWDGSQSSEWQKRLPDSRPSGMHSWLLPMSCGEQERECWQTGESAR